MSLCFKKIFFHPLTIEQCSFFFVPTLKKDLSYLVELQEERELRFKLL